MLALVDEGVLHPTGEAPQLLADLVGVLTTGAPVALFVGDRWAPRHVVLGHSVRDDALRCFDPAAGRTVSVPFPAFTAGRLGLGRWDRSWFVVRPRTSPITG